MKKKIAIFKGTRKVEGHRWGNANKKIKLHLLRQSDVCAICKKKIEKMHDATVDHIIPLSKGGRDTPDNMQIAHARCNSRKGNQYVRARTTEPLIGTTSPSPDPGVGTQV